MRDYTQNEVLRQVELLPTFKGWKKGMYDIWIRSKKDAFDQFDDVVYTFECCKDNFRPTLLYKCTGTTNAGERGLLRFFEYNTIGCAILKSDVLVYNSHKYGLHKGKYPAYVQNKPFPYTRDSNRDKKVDESGKVYNDIIGANCHKAGKKSKLIGGWSVGCLVRNVEDAYFEWMKIMNKRLLSVAILSEF